MVCGVWVCWGMFLVDPEAWTAVSNRPSLLELVLYPSAVVVVPVMHARLIATAQATIDWT